MSDRIIHERPKERVVFDADPYLGEEGENMAVEDYMEREDLTREEVMERHSDSDLFSRALDMREDDYQEETGMLAAYLDGSSDVYPRGEHAGNQVIVYGIVGRWDGTSGGFTVYDGFRDAIDTSPSRFGGDNVFADCEIRKIWDQNGRLFLSGAHHDGTVSVELRQLTGEGVDAYGIVADSYVGEPFTIDGKRYDGGEASVTEAIRDIWDNPRYAAIPRYMERAFGCPAIEWETMSDTAVDSTALDPADPTNLSLDCGSGSTYTM